MAQETQEINTQTNQTTARSIFTFEWENILRIIGAVTGITGVAAALVYLLGYIYVNQSLTSWGIVHSDYYVSLPNEAYLINGVKPFFQFIVNTAGLLILYILIRAFVQTGGRDLLKRIKRPLASLGAGVVLGGIFIYIGISNLSGLFGVTNAIYYTFILTFIGIDILLIAFELVFMKGNKTQAVTQYYNVITSALSAIKMIALGFSILVLFAQVVDPSRINSFGCRYLTESPISATLHSAHSLGLEGKTKSSDVYSYNDYYLLYGDDNYYYFFKELDSETLKPKSIIIIKKDAIEALHLEANKEPSNWNLTKTCSELYGN